MSSLDSALSGLASLGSGGNDVSSDVFTKAGDAEGYNVRVVVSNGYGRADVSVEVNGNKLEEEINETPNVYDKVRIGDVEILSYKGSLTLLSVEFTCNHCELYMIFTLSDSSMPNLIIYGDWGCLYGWSPKSCLTSNVELGWNALTVKSTPDVEWKCKEGSYTLQEREQIKCVDGKYFDWTVTARELYGCIFVHVSDGGKWMHLLIPCSKYESKYTTLRPLKVIEKGDKCLVQATLDNGESDKDRRKVETIVFEVTLVSDPRDREFRVFSATNWTSAEDGNAV